MPLGKTKKGEKKYRYVQILLKNTNEIIFYSTGVADSVGLMVYQGTYALNYVKNYADASKQWSGFPIKTDVPKDCILLGAKGNFFLSYNANAVTKSSIQDLNFILGIQTPNLSVVDFLKSLFHEIDF